MFLFFKLLLSRSFLFSCSFILLPKLSFFASARTFFGVCGGNVSLYSSDCPGICGTPLLFLRSQACTPLLDSVRASLVEEMSWDLRLRFIHLLCKLPSSHFWLWSWRVGLVIKSAHCSYIPCVRICNSSSRGSSAGICSCAYTKPDTYTSK